MDGFFASRKLAGTADTEAVIRGLGNATDLDGVFMDNVLIGFGIALSVGYIPAQFLEKRVYEFTAHLGFVVVAFFVRFQIIIERFD